MLKNKYYTRLLPAILILVVPAVLFLIPVEWLHHEHSLCLYKNLTGYECYGCGMTRAVFSALHFRFEEAVSYNKLVTVIFPLLVYIWAKTLLSQLRNY